MSSASTLFEVGSSVLGYFGLTASWRRPISKDSRIEPQLIIHCCSDSDEGVHTPAASVAITSKAGLLALRAAIDEVLKEGGAA